jgi:hypothetical protein
MSDDNWVMKFFHTLPVEMQKLAWSAKKDELVDSWFDTLISEDGYELPNMVEEELMTLLTSVASDGTDYIELAKDFYETLDRASMNEEAVS